MIFALALAAAPTPPAAKPSTICQDVRPSLVGERSAERAQRLGELPPAQGYLTVMRTENGCIKPVLIREERARRR